LQGEREPYADGASESAPDAELSRPQSSGDRISPEKKACFPQALCLLNSPAGIAFLHSQAVAIPITSGSGQDLFWHYLILFDSYLLLYNIKNIFSFTLKISTFVILSATNFCYLQFKRQLFSFKLSTANLL